MRSFCRATSCRPWFIVTGLFSVCSQLRQEGKCFFRPFVFKKFSASLKMSVGGHKVAVQSMWCEASNVTHHPSLPAPRAARPRIRPGVPHACCQPDPKQPGRRRYSRLRLAYSTAFVKQNYSWVGTIACGGMPGVCYTVAFEIRHSG